MGALHHTKFRCSSCSEALYEIRTGKQDVKPVHVLGYTSISNLGITELLLDNQKGMFHLAADRRLSILDFFIPVEAFVTGRDLKSGRFYVGPEFDITEVFIIPNLRSLFCSTVSRIAVTDFIVFMKEICGFINIMNICSCSGNRMDITVSGINARMDFHAVIPLVAFLV